MTNEYAGRLQKIFSMCESVASLEKDTIHNLLEEARQLIGDANFAYFVDCKSIMPDYQYDELCLCLKKIENAYPDLAIMNNSISKVGHEPLDTKAKVKHKTPMLSLDHFIDPNYLTTAMNKMKNMVKKLQDGAPMLVMAELKIDGLAISLIYEKGTLISAATRGNGHYGENVTPNVMEIEHIPKVLTAGDTKIPDILEIRGEIYLNKKDFEDLRERSRESNIEFSTARNTAAASLKRLDPESIRDRSLRLFAYSCIVHSDEKLNNNKDISTYSQLLDLMDYWGLPINKERRVCHNQEEMLEFYYDIKDRRENLPYEIDGIVYKLEDLGYREQMGYGSSSPFWAVAHKFPAETKETLVKDIKLSVGRTGVITPLAELEQVVISGAKISKANLHSERFVREKDIRVGDTVLVERAGDVIPHIVRVVSKDGAIRQPKFTFPEFCTSCSARLISDGVMVYCPSGLDCPSQALERLKHFTSKDAFDIAGLGEKTIEFLYNERIISEPADIFTLEERSNRGEIVPLSSFKGWGELSEEKLFSSIRSWKIIPIERFLFALGIPNVGKELSKKMAELYTDFETIHSNFTKQNNEESYMINLSNIGEEVTKSVIVFFQDARSLKLINNLLDKITILPFNKEEDDQTNLPYKGRSILFTGKLNDMTRKEAQNHAKRIGFHVTSSLSSTTNFLVAGEKCVKNKVEKAKNNGTTIIDENGWIDMLEKAQKGDL